MRIRLLLNESPFDLAPVCGDGSTDKFGSCKLDAFLSAKVVKQANETSHGHANWEAACRAKSG